MQVTYYGHATFAITHQQTTILFDPFITPNELAKEIDVQSIKPNYIVLSHGHADHIADAIQIAQQSNAVVVSSWEICDWVQKNGVSNTHPMNTGGRWHFNNFTIKCVAAQHSSSLPDGSYGGNPLGFLIQFSDFNLYYAGDTALTWDMKLIPLWTKLNLAFLPIGDNFTMGYEDALLAAEFIACDHIIAMHYDTFGYIKVNQQQVEAAFASKNKKIQFVKIGETIVV